MTQREFDAENRLVKESQGDHFVEHQYDLNGNRIVRRTSRDNQVRYQFDAAGMVSGISINGGDVMAIERDANGLPVKENLGNGLTREYAYNLDGLMTRQSINSSAGIAVERKYEYDPVGNLDPEKKIHEFLYDPAGDLFSENDSKGRDDHLRNRHHDGTDYYFDAAGNLMERSGQRTHLTFEWDAKGQLAAADNHTGNLRTEMTYDALGRRLSKTTGNQISTFTWDGDQLLAEETIEDGYREFIYYPGTFEPLAAIDADRKVYYYHNDPNGLPQEVTDDRGEPVWSARYNAIGEIDRLYTARFSNNIRMQGQYYDEELDLCYNRHRYYDPQTFSFISQDPLGLAAGENVYAYAPNVWGWVDPLGLCGESKGSAGPGWYCDDPIASNRGPSIGDLRKAGQKDAHHIIQDASVRDLPGYNTNAAPGVQLPGPANVKSTPHHIATQVQRQAGGGTYAAERRIGYKALRRSGMSEQEARAAIQRADQYFESIDVTPSTTTRIPGNR